MTLVAGIDSSTQSCKVIIREVETGEVVREGRAAHPDGSEVHPDHWWDALLAAIEDAGGLDDVAAVSVGAQQHGMVLLDQDGQVVREALLWNDTRTHEQVDRLTAELGGPEQWVDRVGLVLAVSFTITKVAWVRDNEPDNADRVAAVCLPHDWLTWRLKGYGPGSANFDGLTTDRSDASGTGYWSAAAGEYRPELLKMALGFVPALPRVVGPTERAGVTGEGIDGVPAGLPIGAGAGDNAAAGLALGLEPGDAVMSLGTSGTIYARVSEPVRDVTGAMAGFADATGDHLPLGATLNAARDLDALGKLLGKDHAQIGELALGAPAGADGLTLLGYFEGERTPHLPEARASLHGMKLSNFTPEHLARATVEGMLASQIVMLRALQRLDVPVERLFVIGGAAKNAAVQQILPSLVDVPVLVPADGEYVALGASVQAAAALTGEFPAWPRQAQELPQQPTDETVMNQHEAAKEALGYPAG